LARAGAAAEVYHGIYLIFELLLPSRNIMQLYIWWQYLRMRYMLDTTGTPARPRSARYIQSLLRCLRDDCWLLLIVVDNFWRPVLATLRISTDMMSRDCVDLCIAHSAFIQVT
jgi:hypothetical protein